MRTSSPLLSSAVLLASTALAAISISCSSVHTVEPRPLSQNVTLKEGDRMPASEPRVYWTKAEKQYLVGQNGIHETFTAEIQQIKEWTESVPYEDTCYRDGYNEQPGYCEGYHCAPGGSGKSEAWDAFFSAPKSGKADALADAIKGIGKASADKLLAANFFNRKPRSWEAFADEIQNAVNSGVIGKDISYQVLVKYKAENVTNLGYDVGSCTTYQYACTIYTPGLVAYPCTKYQDKTYTRVIDSMRRNVSIDVTGSDLQSFETDTATVNVGRDDGDVSAEIGPYNRYNVSVEQRHGMAQIHATGVQRILVDLPRSVVKAGAFQHQGNQGVFGVKINPQFMGEGRDQLVLKYNVNTCKMNFFSICLGGYKAGADVVVPVTQVETAISIPLQSKTKSKVVYSLARKGSHWYNDNYTSNFETDSISQK